ncbi:MULTISPECIES: XRE family transcriptional regulator [Buttiauxella]|uniref:XRE family transcriptional regulator n=1 Tax=Buttiauxella TaxID=82976 RepID=UPI00397578E4
MKNTLAERLKMSRLQAGLSQKLLGEKVGISQAAIQKLENGSAKTSTKLIEIARVLGVRPEWLSEENGPMFSESSIPAESQWGTVDAWDGDSELPDDEVEVPFLKDIELACGHGRCVNDDYNGFKLRFSKSTLRRVGAQKENVICFPATGNSMEPIIPDGTTVAIDIGNKKIIDGKVYAINQDGWKRLKLLHRIGPNRVSIRSYNSSEYPDEEADLEDLEIMGRMFWSSTIW